MALETEGMISDLAGASTSAPAVTAVTPTPSTAPGAAGGMSANYIAAAVTPIVVDVTDPDGAADLVVIQVCALFLDGSAETVYRGGAFTAAYSAGSTAAPVADGTRLSILRRLGWPAAIDGNDLAVGIAVDVTDVGGNVVTAVLYYRMPPSTSVEVEAPSVNTGAVDHVAAALSRLCQQFRP